MDSMDNFRERIEALEQRMKVMGAHTRMVERRLRWGRGIAWGVALGLLGMALWAMPVGAAPFAYVTHECDSSVSVIATATNTVVTTVAVAECPDLVAMTPTVKPVNKCPLGQGFWKNHPAAWPVTSLTLGSQSYTQAALLALLDTPPRGDASLILADQLIAAKLNIANGSDPAPVSATITDADSLLSQFGSNRLPYSVGTSSAIGQQMVNDANVLDRYNNGDLTPDCQP